MTFGSLGYGPRAQSALHCHGVLALRHGPWTPAWTEAVQNESRLQEDTSRGGSWQCRNAGKVKVWSRRTKAGSRRTGAGWQLAVQKRRKSQGLELVSSRFRK